MGLIHLLDCTLRDGGHVNQGKFGREVIKSIIENLAKAKLDIIEVGFLWSEETDLDTARYHSIEELKRVLPTNLGKAKLSLMADNVELDDLEPYDGTVEFIRLSFRKSEFEWAERNAKIAMEKGYKVFINPIHGSAYSDADYLAFIDRVNKLNPYGFSLVDTFGAFRQADLGRLYYLIEHNLNKNIVLGIHLHENLGLSYSLAQYITNIVAPTRDIIIDGSLMGMGKVPGNLCIEQMMDYLNNSYDYGYATEPVYDAIDEYIMPIKSITNWGYLIPYAISAQCKVHRSYAEYLTQKERLCTKDIRRILKAVEESKAEIFDEQYIEQLYQSYMASNCQGIERIEEIAQLFDSYSKILIVAPGASIKNIAWSQFVDKSTCVISVNFIPDNVDVTFAFFTNVKRVHLAQGSNTDLVVTSNLGGIDYDIKHIVSWNDLVYHDDIYCDDSTMMLLNLLKQANIREVSVAGFDGFIKGHENFCLEILKREVRNDDYVSENKITILKKSYLDMNIDFITRSIYENYNK